MERKFNSPAKYWKIVIALLLHGMILITWTIYSNLVPMTLLWIQNGDRCAIPRFSRKSLQNKPPFWIVLSISFPGPPPSLFISLVSPNQYAVIQNFVLTS